MKGIPMVRILPLPRRLPRAHFYLFLLLLPAFVRNEAENNMVTIRAVVGTRANLPCDIEVPRATADSGNGTISLILWYHGSIDQHGGIPIYSLDALDQPLEHARPWPSAEYSNRAYFDVISRPPVLKIDPVLESDAGEYRCRVDFTRSRTQNRIVRLEVITPPSELRIRDADGRTLSGVIGPYNEGSSLVLVCEATDAKPRARVSWWRDDELIDDSDRALPDHPRRLVSNELVIKRLQRSHLLITLTCRADNVYRYRYGQAKAGGSPSKTVRTANVTIDMNLPPLDIEISSNGKEVGKENYHRQQEPLSTRKQSVMTCTSKGGRPHPQLTWWINGRKLNVLRESVIHGDNYTSNTVTFVPSVDHNNKFLSCRADSNPLISEHGLEDSRRLDVHYLPQLKVLFGQHMTNTVGALREGSDVYLECEIRANPPVSEVFWKFEGRPLEADGSNGIIMANRSLALQKVRRSSQGRYQCVASNTEGEAQSDPIQLVVHYLPVCRKQQILLYGVASNEDAEIPCNVDSDPPPTEFRWTLNETNIEYFDERAFSFNTSNRAVITYRPQYAKMYGTLRCWATNEIGTQEDPCSYQVVPASPPDSPHDCTVRNQSFSTILVNCKAGDAGGLHQSFHLEVFNFAHEYLESNLTQQEAPIFHVNDLAASTKYIFLLYAANAKGRSTPISFTALTAVPPVEKSLHNGAEVRSSTVKAEVVFLLVGVAVVVIILLGLILALRRRRNAKNAHNSMHKQASLASIGDKTGGSCRSLKSPFADEFQLDQVIKAYHNQSKAKHNKAQLLLPFCRATLSSVDGEQRGLRSTSGSGADEAAVAPTAVDNDDDDDDDNDEVLQTMLMADSCPIDSDPSTLEGRKAHRAHLTSMRNSRRRLDQSGKAHTMANVGRYHRPDIERTEQSIELSEVSGRRSWYRPHRSSSDGDLIQDCRRISLVES